MFEMDRLDFVFQKNDLKVEDSKDSDGSLWMIVTVIVVVMMMLLLMILFDWRGLEPFLYLADCTLRVNDDSIALARRGYANSASCLML